MTETNPDREAKRSQREAEALERANALLARQGKAPVVCPREARKVLAQENERVRQLRAIERANKLPGQRVRNYAEAMQKLRKRRAVLQEQRELEQSYAPVAARLAERAEARRVTEIIHAEKVLERVAPKFERHEAEKRKERKRRGKKKVTLPAVAGLKKETWIEPHVTLGRVSVTVTSRSTGLRGLVNTRTIQRQHERAAMMFAEDWETAFSSVLRSRGFDPGVDGGRTNTGLPISLQAAQRLRDLRDEMGEEPFSLVLAVVCFGATPTDLHRAGAEEHVRVGQDIKRALDRVVDFYTPGRRRRNRTYGAVQTWIQRALDGREVTLEEALMMDSK